MKKIDIDRISISPKSTLKQAMQAINRGGLGVVFIIDENHHFFTFPTSIKC